MSALWNRRMYFATWDRHSQNFSLIKKLWIRRLEAFGLNLSISDRCKSNCNSIQATCSLFLFKEFVEFLEYEAGITSPPDTSKTTAKDNTTSPQPEQYSIIPESPFRLFHLLIFRNASRREKSRPSNYDIEQDLEELKRRMGL